MAGTNWTLQYLRHRKHRPAFPSIWWPVSMPWGGLLTAIVMFLWIQPAHWDRIARLCAIATLEMDPSVSPLAVLRMRANGAASLSYSPPGNIPGVPGATVRREFTLLPAPPLPEHLRRLAEKWTLVGDENEFRAGQTSGMRRSRPMLLLAEQYRSRMDWIGMQHGLREAQAAGIVSELVFVEADDDATTEAVVGAVDLCAGLGLNPVFRLGPWISSPEFEVGVKD